MKIWKDQYCIPEDKFKRVLNHPKYLYSTDVLDKILKLRNIFLEFDEDGSSNYNNFINNQNTNNIFRVYGT